MVERPKRTSRTLVCLLCNKFRQKHTVRVIAVTVATLGFFGLSKSKRQAKPILDDSKLWAIGAARPKRWV
jgi:hypothetical protein